jgi:broad specificity phosphatase PhoE
MAASLAPLTQLGRLQIDTIANDFRLEATEAILCSSYARALESAALLSRKLNKPLYVEYDLHEWLAHKDPLAEIDKELLERARAGLEQELTGHISDTTVPWETLSEVRARVIGVLKRYAHYSSLLVVSHAVVMTSLLGEQRAVEHAEIIALELDLSDPAIMHLPQRRLLCSG